ncbi:MAG: hypothetical protein JWQ72_1365 [Polaromonas sp.]|nr:hypothetical protein [Polaromonas sp.]
MKFSLKPSAAFNSMVLAGLLATVGASAMAQGAPSAPPAGPAASSRPSGPPGERMGRHDPAKMQAWIARRQADLKGKLKITPAQEGAWSTYTAASQPPARTGARPTPEQRAEFAKLTTPQRIDKMREMRAQRMTAMNAAMDKRADATKSLYAALSPEQQKVFDAESLKGHGHGGKGRHGGPGPQKG